MIVVITAEAETDLERIGDYIATDNPLRAESFVRELIDKCHSLKDAPHVFPLVPRHESSGIRRRLHGRYLIFYIIGAEKIDVLHIIHGAQDYEAIVFPT